MKTYRICWTIDIEAENAVAAAKEALQIQRDPGSEALIFEVICMQDPNNDEPMKVIDLWEMEDEDNKASTMPCRIEGDTIEYTFTNVKPAQNGGAANG